MPFPIPSLKDFRKLGRDKIAGALVGANAGIPNNALRVLSDENSEKASLVAQYLGWISRQMLPDTAEMAGVLRWGVIKGVLPKTATFASGSVSITGTAGAPLPAGSEMTFGDVVLQSTSDVIVGSGPTTVSVIALAAGTAGNIDAGSAVSLTTAAAAINSSATVVLMSGGTDYETIDQFRPGVLAALRKPPMGGDADDYVAWALDVPGVTRAWCSPNEMGVGTVTVRFMMDFLRAEAGGFPTDGDIATVSAYLNTVRPVAVKDFFVVSPIAEPISFTVSNLDSDDTSTREAISLSVAAMIADAGSPAFAENGVMQNAQTIYAAWVSKAILEAAGVKSFDLSMSDHAMPTNGSLATLGMITYSP